MHLCLNHFSLCTLYAFRHFVLCVWPSWSIVTIVPVSAPSAPQSLKLGCNPPTDSHGRHTAGFTDKDWDRSTSLPRILRVAPCPQPFFTSFHHLHHLSAPAALAYPKQDLMDPVTLISSDVETHRCRNKNIKRSKLSNCLSGTA